MSTPPAADPASLIAGAPLEELSRDRLSVFLYLCFTSDELLELVRRLGLTVAGYRQEHLSDADRADLLADRLRESRAVRRLVGERLRKVLGPPALAGDPLEPDFAARLVEAWAGEAGLSRILWRLLSDRRPEVRAAAGPALDRLVEEEYGEEPELPAGALEPEARPAGPPEDESARAPLREARRQLAQALRERDRVGRERDRALAGLAKLKAQLHEARAAAAAGARELSTARKAGRVAAGRIERLEAALAEARGKAGAAAAARLRRELEKALHRIAVLEAERPPAPPVAATPEVPAEAARADAPPVPNPAAAPGNPEPPEAPATWLLPVYTREFYDSLRGWERRIQRAAFKQADLLARDHRHPSLRALPLEGLPNLYRVRVATDVRLLYRRGDGNTVEILSLIDREDLDRYIKQAKERG